MVTLWQWSVRRDQWEFVTQCTPELKRRVKANAARRNPSGTVFRFTEGDAAPLKKYRQRTVKEKA